MAVYIDGEQVGTVIAAIPADLINSLLVVIAMVSAVAIVSALVKIFRRM
jgi:hypothetical protein